MHPCLVTLFAAWDEAEVRFAFLRVPQHVDAPSGDVDLLIHPADRSRAKSVLHEAGFVRLPADGYGSNMFYLGYHSPTNSWIWLHIAQQITFGRNQDVRTEVAGAVLMRRVRRASGWALCAEDAFWGVFLHCVLDKRDFPARHRERLSQLAAAATGDGPLARVAERILPGDWSPSRVIEAVSAADWMSLEALAPLVPLPARPAHVLVTRLRRLRTRLRDARRRGLVVALMGPDGAGKSTLAKGIQQTFFFPSTSLYMGVGSGRVADIARRLSLFHRPPFTYFAFISTLWMRYLAGQYYRWQGRLVIFDRYTYDALLPMPGGVSKLKAAALRIQAWICPAPDLLIVLDVPGDVMFQRKREFSPEHLESQRQTLLSLRDSLPRVEVLDGTLPRETVRSEAVKRIWNVYADRLQRAG